MLFNSKHWPELSHTLTCISSAALSSCRPPCARHNLANTAIRVLFGQSCHTPLCCTYTRALSTLDSPPHENINVNYVLSITLWLVEPRQIFNSYHVLNWGILPTTYRVKSTTMATTSNDTNNGVIRPFYALLRLQLTGSLLLKLVLVWSGWISQVLPVAGKAVKRPDFPQPLVVTGVHVPTAI